MAHINYKIGDIDYAGRIVKSIIYTRKDYCTVYKVKKELSVCFVVTTQEEIPNNMMAYCSEIISLIPNKNKRYNFVYYYVEQIIISAFEKSDKDIINRYITQAKEEIKEEIKKERILNYVSSAGLLIAFVYIVPILLDYLAKTLYFLSPLHLTILNSTLGCFMSQLIIVNEYNDSSPIGKAEGIFKILFSIISGFFIYLLIHSNILFGFVESNSYLLYLISFIAGFQKGYFLNIVKKSNEILDSRLSKVKEAD